MQTGARIYESILFRRLNLDRTFDYCFVQPLVRLS